MTSIVALGLLLSSALYLFIGVSQGRYNKSIGDLLPLVFGRNARVDTTDEFSSSTVATSVSLATIVLAYFELAGYFGLYLLWTAATTALGMWLLSRMSGRIWKRLSAYDHRPSLHEFLGTEFASPTVSLGASLCTTVGFLLIFATELLVGSRFLASLIPQIPEWVTVLFLSSVGFVYTLVGGFRAVIKTDQLQMKMIWGLIAVLGAFYVYQIARTGGLAAGFARAPDGLFNLSYRPGLGFFLVGIAIMNIPTHLSNMAVWQRISGSHDAETVGKGLRGSIWQIALSWGLLALLACFAYLIVSPESSQTILSELLVEISRSPVGSVVLFVVVLGLYGAMLSTASTLLIVITHTVSEDIFAKTVQRQSLDERLRSRKAFLSSRFILVFAALLAVLLVEGLNAVGFSIADLVFSIYGGALALFPLIAVALYVDRSRLRTLSSYANAAVGLGFLSGWGTAFLGKAIGDPNVVFLSPTVGIAVSAAVLTLGFLLRSRRGSFIAPVE